MRTTIATPSSIPKAQKSHILHRIQYSSMSDTHPLESRRPQFETTLLRQDIKLQFLPHTRYSERYALEQNINNGLDNQFIITFQKHMTSCLEEQSSLEFLPKYDVPILQHC